MIEGIIASLVAALIVSAISAVSSIRVREWVQRKLLESRYARKVRQQGLIVGRDDSRHLVRLAEFLRNDQERDPHSQRYGEFDKNLRHRHQAEAHVKLEALNVKPRMYVTGWPVFVLAMHPEVPNSQQMLRAVAVGMAKQLADSWVRIVLPASPGGSPWKVAETISYRHTMRAAQILAALKGGAVQPKVLLGRMLDASQDMQCENGGWRQCRDVFRDECLWASAYAAGFLYTSVVQAEEMGLSLEVRRKAEMALERTLAWLHARWDLDRWQHDDLSAEENAPELWHEVAGAALERRPLLAQDVLDRFDSFLDALHRPSPAYVATVTPFSADRVAIRLAYAYFQAIGRRQGATERFAALLQYALMELSMDYDCVEAAMLLDMLSSRSARGLRSEGSENGTVDAAITA